MYVYLMSTNQTLTAATLYAAGTLTYEQAKSYAGNEQALENALSYSAPEPPRR